MGTATHTSLVRVPKILGADVELGNFIDGLRAPRGTGAAASRMLLSQIPGIPAGVSRVRDAQNDEPSVSVASDLGQGGRMNSAQDWGRRFLPGNAGCAYIDLDHLEIALPETLSAFDHVVYWRAMLTVARTAALRANRQLRAGYRVQAFANSSDGHGQSYGAHVSVLLSKPAWDDIVYRRPHYLGYLAAFQVSSIVFTGAGKVGSENGRPWADFQLSQRADFFETFVGEQTTFHRPLVNARHEPLCGPFSSPLDQAGLARLHVIFFDPTLCQFATLLRVGTLQIVTAMIEAGCITPQLFLDDALDALQRWSHDPQLSSQARLVDGTHVTAVELQERFLDEARRFHDANGFEGLVPRAAQILNLWEDTLRKLREGDFASLGRRLDWVLKRQVLQGAIASRPSLSWSSPELRHLDQLFAAISVDEGLFWACEQAGLVDVLVSENDIHRAVHEPPENTRAWTRAQLLRHTGSHTIEHVDWDVVRIRLASGRSPWAERHTVCLPRPFGGTKAENQELFNGTRSFEDVLTTLMHDAEFADVSPTFRVS